MLTTAVPYEEAAEFLAGKPAVSRALFDRLLPELKARAFTIMAVDSADALQAARDAIATIPRGEDWDKVKKHLAASLEPWLGEGAAVRTEMLMRWHAYQAYAVANKRNLDANTDLFPYRQYQTAKDGRVRASHAALEGVTLPHDSPFWDRHTPPWEYGCRCDVRGVTAEEADEIREADAGKDEQKRRVLEGPMKDQLEQFGRLQRGDNEIYDVRTPSERGETGVEWSSKDLTIPLDALRARYDADVWKRFTDWAEKTEIDGLGTVWGWLSGEAVVPALDAAVKIVGKTADEARVALAALASEFAAAESEVSGLLAGRSRYIYDQAPDMRSRIPGLEEAYAKRDELLAKARAEIAVDPDAVRPFEPKTSAKKDRNLLIEQQAEALDLWAKMIGADKLKAANARLPLRLVRHQGRAYYLNGKVHQSTYDTVSVHMHELGHWLEDSSPEMMKRSVDFLERRTAGDPITYYFGRLSEPVKEDKFWSNYCGKQYKRPGGDFYATEIVSMGIERFTFDPIRFAAEDADYFDFIYDTLRKL